MRFRLRSIDYKRFNDYVSKSDSYRSGTHNFTQEKVETLAKENSSLANSCMEVFIEKWL